MQPLALQLGVGECDIGIGDATEQGGVANEPFFPSEWSVADVFHNCHV